MSEILHQKIESASGREMADLALAKQIAEVLDRHYPDHMWGVHADSLGGVATIKNFRLSGNWGFVLHLPTIYSGSEFEKRVMMAGGELLERYQLHRGRFKQNDYDKLPVNNARRHEAAL